MSLPRLLLACLALLWLGCAHATVHDDQATDRAFDALLSMPQAQPPDGDWNVAAPSGYDGSSEDDLITWLAQQQKAGADFNAYRHDGTLLQHAIRSHLPSATRWLLAHGADPALTMRDADGLDTLGYAIEQGQWTLVDTMRAMPAYRKLTPQQLTARYLPFMPDALTAMLQHRFAMPEGETARCMLQYALEHGQFSLALRLPVHRIPDGDSRVNGAPGWCYHHEGNGRSIATSFASLAPATLQRLDAKLDRPLFPYLLPTLATAQDVRSLFAVPLRKPAAGAALGQTLRPWIVPPVAAGPSAVGDFLPLAVREALAAQLPPTWLAATLQDRTALGAWLKLAAQGSTSDYAAALGRVPDSALAAHPATAVEVVSYAPAAASKWPLLLARSALPLGGGDIPALLERVPVALWAPLFDRGYRPRDKRTIGYGRNAQGEIAHWLRTAEAQDIKLGWPMLSAYVPHLAETAIATLLWQPREFAPFGCVDYQYFSSQDLDKIRTLIALGARVKPYPFPAAAAQCTTPAIYSQLTALGVVAPYDATAPKRFFVDAMHCQVVADDTWLKTLAAQSLDGEAASMAITSIQPIDYPHQAKCALLVTGGDPMYRHEIDDEDFNSGPYRLTPCGDSTVVEQVWLRRADRLETSPLHAETAGLVPLRDRTDGRRYYLAYAIPGGGGCAPPGEPPPMLLTWSTQPPYRLQVVDGTSPALVALQTQCNLWKVDACLGIRGYDNPNAPSAESRQWDTSRLTNAFIDHFFARQRADWIAAALKLDTDRLRQLEADGAPATWVLAGIDAVTHSKLSLPERRQRTAWLFRDHARLHAAFAASDYTQVATTVFGLDAWLPREDWRPLLEALSQGTVERGSEYTPLQNLARDAQARGKPGLACRFLHAAGKACAITPSQ